MNKYKYIRILCFLIILASAAGYTFYCYSFPKTYITRSYEAFYDEPKNAIDGVMFGTSVVANGWAAPVSWHEYGMPVYQLGGTVQPFGPLQELIDFVRSRQDIKYVIVDIHALRTKAIKKSVRSENVMRASSSIHLGPHRYKVLQASLTYAEKVYEFYGLPENPEHIISKNDTANYFPFINFHNRWVDGLEKADYVSVPSEYKGALDEHAAFSVKDVSDLLDLWETKPTQLDAFQKDVLDEFFAYLNGTDVDVLFINYPSFNTKEELSQLRAVSEYIKDNGLDMLDMCSSEILDKTELDTHCDFRDESHLNSAGACKATKYICSYIKEKYYYKDHRDDPAYESWNDAVAAYNEFLKNGWAEKDRNVDFIKGIF